MSDEIPERPKRLFLIEIRGLLEFEADTPAEATAAAEEWIIAAGRGEAPPKKGTSVRWLRIDPQSDENIGWPPRETER